MPRKPLTRRNARPSIDRLEDRLALSSLLSNVSLVFESSRIVAGGNLEVDVKFFATVNFRASEPYGTATQYFEWSTPSVFWGDGTSSGSNTGMSSPGETFSFNHTYVVSAPPNDGQTYGYTGTINVDLGGSVSTIYPDPNQDTTTPASAGFSYNYTFYNQGEQTGQRLDLVGATSNGSIDLQPTELAPDADGFDIGYQINGAALATGEPVVLDWATGTTADSAIGAPFFSLTSATAPGSYGPIDAPIHSADPRPADANYVLLVTDPDNVLGQSDGVANVIPLALPPIAVTSFSKDPDDGGYSFTYGIYGNPLAQATTVELSWATGTTADSVIGSPIVDEATQTAPGTYTTDVTAAQLGTPPAGSKDLLVVVDPGNQASPANPEKVAAIALSNIAATSLAYDEVSHGVDFSYTISGAPLPQATTAELFWSPAPTFDATNDTFAYGASTETDPGTTIVTVDPSRLLAAPPEGTKYLLEVVDATGSVSDSDTSDNVFPLSLVSPGVSYPVDLTSSTAALPPILKDPEVTPLAGIAYHVALDTYTAAFTEQQPTFPAAQALYEAVGTTGSAPRQVEVTPYNIVTGQPITPAVHIGINTTVTVTLFSSAPTQAPPADEVCTQATGAKDRWLIDPYTPGDLVLRWYTPGFTTVIGGVNSTGPLEEWLDLNKLVPQDSALTAPDQLVYDAEQVIETANQSLVFKAMIANVASIFDPGDTNLLITDPEGRQTGVLADGTVVDNIPFSAYFPSIPAVFIAQPETEPYETQVTGVASGDYEVVIGLETPSNVVAQQTVEGTLAEGQSTTYSAEFDTTDGSLAVQSPTDLSDVSGTGTFAGVATLSATLTAGGTPLADRTVVFTLNLNGNIEPIGSATTDQNGVASLGGVKDTGFSDGTTVAAVEASFAGDSADLGSDARGDLVLQDATTRSDFFGDGRDDLGVYGYGRFIIAEPSTGKTIVQAFGGPEDVPVVGDFLGDGHDDLGVQGYQRYIVFEPGTNKTLTQAFGGPEDVPVVGDFFGDGRDDFGVFGYQRYIIVDPSTGKTIVQPLGGPQDLPVVGDFFGNGHDDLGVYGYGRFLVFDPSTGKTLTQAFGGPEDVPVVGDFFGNGHDDLGVYGYGRFIVFDPSTGKTIVQPLGGPEDVPVVGDFFGDGYDDFGVYGYGRYAIVDPSTGKTLIQSFGGPDDVPVVESAATILHRGTVRTESIASSSIVSPSVTLEVADLTLDSDAIVASGSTDPTPRTEAVVSPAGSTPAGPSSLVIKSAARRHPASTSARSTLPREQLRFGVNQSIDSPLTKTFSRTAFSRHPSGLDRRGK